MDYKNIWKKTLKNLKKDLPQHTFEAWIDTLDPVGSSDSIFILEAPNQFAYDWIINNYFDLIQAEIQAVESSLSLKISIAPQSSQNIKVAQIQEDEPTKQNSPGRRVNINPGSFFS
jgi:chromosomal replication initiator protein